MHICMDASFVWQNNHISVCIQPVLTIDSLSACLVNHSYLNCCIYQPIATQIKACYKTYSTKAGIQWSPLCYTNVQELMPDFHLMTNKFTKSKKKPTESYLKANTKVKTFFKNK